MVPGAIPSSISMPLYPVVPYRHAPMGYSTALMSLDSFRRGSQSSLDDMQWNFDTTRETRPAVRSSIRPVVSNGPQEEDLVNHSEGSRAPEAAQLDSVNRVPSQPTRLSNGVEDNTEDMNTTRDSPSHTGGIPSRSGGTPSSSHGQH